MKLVTLVSFQTSSMKDKRYFVERWGRNYSMDKKKKKNLGTFTCPNFHQSEGKVLFIGILNFAI